MTKRTWNERLRHALTVRGVSQRELARLCKVSDPTVHAWVTDQARIHADNKEKIDAVLRLPQRYLFEGVGNLDDPGGDTAEDEARRLAESMTPAELLEFMRPLTSRMSAEERLQFVHLISAIPPADV